MLQRLAQLLAICWVSAYSALAAGDTAVPSATLVTLHLKDEPLSKTLQAITAQTGLLFDKNGPRPREGFPDPTISIDRDKAPFWEIMADLSRASGVSPLDCQDGRVTLFVDRGVWGRRPVSLAGPIRVSAQEVQSRRMVLLGRSPTQTASTELSLLFQVEPKLVAVAVEGLELQSVADQDGHPLAVPGNQNKRASEFQRGSAGCQVPIDRSPTTQRLSTFRGTAAVLLATDPKSAEVSDILHANDVRQQFGDVTIHVTCKTLPEQYSVELIVDYAGNDEDFAKRLVRWLPSADIELVDGAGATYPFGGGSAGAHGHLGARRTIFFPQHPQRPPVPGAPEKLHWRVPTGFQAIPIAFEFHDLDLP